MSARLRRWMGHWVGGCVRAVSALAMAAALAGCGASSSLHTPEVMEIAVLGFNDFHGNLEPPRLAVPVPASTGASQVPAGGAAYFAGAVAALKAQHEALAKEHASSIREGDASEPGLRSESTYLNIIGGLLTLLLGKSPAGSAYSSFRNMDAVVSALLAHHEGRPGISERTLWSKLAQARRHLEASR